MLLVIFFAPGYNHEQVLEGLFHSDETKYSNIREDETEVQIEMDAEVQVNELEMGKIDNNTRRKLE